MSASTIRRLRARTPDISTFQSLFVIPNSSLLRKKLATFALRMMFLLGRHAIFGHDPPTYLRSISAVRFPDPARCQAMYLPASPLPSTTASYSSICGKSHTLINKAGKRIRGNEASAPLIIPSCSQPFRDHFIDRLALLFESGRFLSDLHKQVAVRGEFRLVADRAMSRNDHHLVGYPGKIG